MPETPPMPETPAGDPADAGEPEVTVYRGNDERPSVNAFLPWGRKGVRGEKRCQEKRCQDPKTQASTAGNQGGEGV